MKLVYTPLSVSFPTALVTNFPFSGNSLPSRKESEPFILVSIENLMFLCFH